MNMGWGGFADAWYNLPTVDTSHYDYDTLSDCVYNIYPEGSGEIVSGRVTGIDGFPIPGATVSANPGGYSDTTDANGIYALAKIESQWTGAIDRDWSLQSNWSRTDSSMHALIASASRQPIIYGGHSAECYSLEIAKGGTLVIEGDLEIGL